MQIGKKITFDIRDIDDILNIDRSRAILELIIINNHRLKIVNFANQFRICFRSIQ